ncbi:MAG: hypothetical protein R3D25_15620 [Geminicoccaceae bacterium]
MAALSQLGPYPDRHEQAGSSGWGSTPASPSCRCQRAVRPPADLAHGGQHLVLTLALQEIRELAGEADGGPLALLLDHGLVGQPEAQPAGREGAQRAAPLDGLGGLVEQAGEGRGALQHLLAADRLDGALPLALKNGEGGELGQDQSEEQDGDELAGHAARPEAAHAGSTRPVKL